MLSLRGSASRTRVVFSYDGTQVEEQFYSGEGELYRKQVTTLDEKGNEVEQTVNEPRGNRTTRYAYSYEFDAKGNWMKRTTSKWVTKEGKSFFEPSYVTYRTITYY